MDCGAAIFGGVISIRSQICNHPSKILPFGVNHLIDTPLSADIAAPKLVVILLLVSSTGSVYVAVSFA